MSIWTDLGFKQAFRRIGRERLFTAVTLLTLGLGIAASTAVFSVVDGVLLEPLPYESPEELVTVFHSAPGVDMERIPESRSSHVVYRESSHSFQAMALHSGVSLTLTEAGDPDRLVGRRITPSLFRVLRVQPALGRPFREEEGEVGGPAVVILSHGLWTERFGADPDLLARTIQLNGRSYEVVGVMPEDFAFPNENVDLWIPLPIDPTSNIFQGFNEEGISRLAEGVTPAAARQDLQALIPRLSERFPGLSPAFLDELALQAQVRPYIDDVVGEVRTALWVLLGTVGFVLFIACANVANLMLVRAEGRRREVALRTAIGADQIQLLRQHVTESLILVGAGAGLGLFLAWQSLILLRKLGGGHVPRMDQVELDGSVLLFTMGLMVLAVVTFALIPILRNRSLQPAQELRDGSRSSTGGPRGVKAREVLVAGQVALALVLLVGSGLMVRSFSALQNVDPGFDSEGLLTFRVSLPENDYPDPFAVSAFHERFLERIRSLPGVQEAGAVSRLPVGGMAGINGFFLASDPPPPGEMAPFMETRGVTPGYFEALGIPVLRGRGPEWSDGADGHPIVIVSEKAIQTLMADGTVGGRDVILGRSLGAEVMRGVSASDAGPPLSVVGVVGDVHNVSLVEEPIGTVYYTALQGEEETQSWLVQSMDYAVRTSGDPLSLVASLRVVLREEDARLPLSRISTMEERVARAQARMVFTLTMLGLASIMGLILGAVGLYGVISHVTAHRTREIGLRMALGAEGSAVRGMVLRKGMAVSGLGVLAGLVGAWALSRSLQSLLFGVEATDPLTYAGVTGVLLAVSFLATWLPAHKASSVDVVQALGSE